MIVESDSSSEEGPSTVSAKKANKAVVRLDLDVSVDIPLFDEKAKQGMKRKSGKSGNSRKKMAVDNDINPQAESFKVYRSNGA